MTQEFFPINTPLINYFFYKAPFISNSYVLTGGVVGNPGTNYFVNDLIVLGEGSFNSPAVIKVTSTNPHNVLGAVTGFIITSGGDYITTPGAGLDQLYSSSIGTGFTLADPVFAPKNQIPPGPNIPLAGGFLYFYANEDHTMQLPTYSDISDPNNPVVNTNPIQLGAAGDCPLFYLENRPYYIVITDNTGDQANPVTTISNYNPSQVSSEVGAFNDNFLVNPQFNYPIRFFEDTQEDGQIALPLTTVAWGWQFYQDEDTLSQNFITFENISGQNIEGSPIFQLLLTCSTVTASETLKDLVQIFGTVDFLSGQNLTFSAQMISEEQNNLGVNLILELNYGENGSDTRFIILTTFSVQQVRQKYFFTFEMPSITGYMIGDNNYAALHIQPGLMQLCEFGITNCLLEPGTVSLPAFVDEPKSFSKSQIVGDSIDINHAGLFQNYSSYYYNDGTIFPYADTGAIILGINNWNQSFRLPCDGRSIMVSKYINGIPNRRLYNVIGNTFGGSGELIVTASQNVVTFSSGVGARENSAYTAGTTAFTVTNTVIGLGLGINLVNNNNNTLNGEFIDQFAPDQTITPYQFNPFLTSGAAVANYWGTNPAFHAPAHAPDISPNNITITTVLPGSPTQNSTFILSFNSLNINDYITRAAGLSSDPQIGSWIELASFSNNSRRPSGQNSNNQQVLFQLDGVSVPQPGLPSSYAISVINRKIVNFRSNLSLAENINIFVQTVANPFQWTVTVNSAPLAGQYFLFSDSTTDFYAWFTVNGAGTDPAIGGRTGVEIPIFGGQDENTIAGIIAETLNDLEFNLPSPSDLPTLVAGSKVSYYINL